MATPIISRNNVMVESPSMVTFLPITSVIQVNLSGMRGRWLLHMRTYADRVLVFPAFLQDGSRRWEACCRTACIYSAVLHSTHGLHSSLDRRVHGESGPSTRMPVVWRPAMQNICMHACMHAAGADVRESRNTYDLPSRMNDRCCYIQNVTII